MSKKNNGGHLTIQYNLRWTEEMREKITQEAKKNTRSMNQEIISRLDKSFELDSQNLDSSNGIDNTSLAVIADDLAKHERVSDDVAAALKGIAIALKTL